MTTTSFSKTTNGLNKIKLIGVVFCIFLGSIELSGQNPPLMGWASWNQYGVNINDSIIKVQADAMVSSGLIDAGFQYINIDDGFFNGRYADGALKIDEEKFPYGMKSLADYIHSIGLKAGFYSEAGINTCGSIWSNSAGGVGSGLYNHDQQDIDTIFSSWGYDFLKVDFCGGQEQKLDEKTRYTEIKNAINNTGRNDINFNVCRWQFPGVWVTSMADSWRISQDINFSPGSTPQWSSILSIIDLNTYLAPFASPGHYNDMDMLEVGRGLSAEEDKSHMSMWCILSSPLLLGNDLSSMSQQTIDLLTNAEVIAVNQDTTGLQAHLIYNKDNLQIWAKNLNGKRSNERAIVLFNRSETSADLTFNIEDLNLIAPVSVRDLWSQTDLEAIESTYITNVPSHGVVMLKLVGTSTKLQEVFEGEYAWINNFNLTQNSSTVSDQGRAETNANCSGGAKAGWLGNGADNFIEFRDVYSNNEGRFFLTMSIISGENRNATISINGQDTTLSNLNSGGWSTIKDFTFAVNLRKGYNTIRISNATGWLPDIDKIQLQLNNKFTSVGHINNQQSIKVYPNPANSTIQIASISPIQEVEVYSLDEKLMGQYNQATFSVIDYVNGVYILKVKTDNTLFNQLFVKK